MAILLRANIETEIAPIVGTEDQAKDLLTFIKQEAETEHGIWETNIFGKSVEELVMDGIRSKIAMIGDESQKSFRIQCRRLSMTVMEDWCASSYKNDLPPA